MLGWREVKEITVFFKEATKASRHTRSEPLSRVESEDSQLLYASGARGAGALMAPTRLVSSDVMVVTGQLLMRCRRKWEKVIFVSELAGSCRSGGPNYQARTVRLSGAM